MSGYELYKNKRKEQTASYLKANEKWRPMDDYLLIYSVEQMNNLAVVHNSVEFSCRYSLEEITTRWHQLLYVPGISIPAREAIQNLPCEIIEKIHQNTVWTRVEEKALSTVPSYCTPTMEDFNVLLFNNGNIFKQCRTPHSLSFHWNIMKKYQLLVDQLVPMIKNSSLSWINSKIERESEGVNVWQSRINEHVFSTNESSVINEHIASTSDNERYIAVLTGRNVTFLVTKDSVTIGDNQCDLNVTVDSPFASDGIGDFSALLRFDVTSSSFVLSNVGSKALIVDELIIAPQHETVLKHLSKIKVGCYELCFYVMFNIEALNNLVRRRVYAENYCSSITKNFIGQNAAKAQGLMHVPYK